ncbi:hypothetical protein PAXRUDRAFT_825752 [Paxillus rubicundulus Ve08.2h10]|uniref:Uncharacterized protein n=1 Tax=Paxillus rubicundulus Ve08.2h10 TaxID=930991 RepID=A0A0D0E5G3_9AGAM|nr:hypothetical protein PAXRUDRAFT_825752 [Paxillus rubicundulus Ve08.2h10]
MEWVPTEFGRRKPVIGGHDHEGRLLYYALVPIESFGPRVLGMVANHTRCAKAVHGGTTLFKPHICQSTLVVPTSGL